MAIPKRVKTRQKAAKKKIARSILLKLFGICLASFFAWSAGEGLLFLLPARNQMDNPWYLDVGGGTSASDELPFERPPHLNWTGLSRGDLAFLAGDEDPYARWITFRTDSEGFRNGRDMDKADLVFLGDSYTEAGNIPEEESYAYLVGQRLHLSARNLGRAGYCPPSELVVLNRYGLKCQPKTVIWQIAESNDLPGSLEFENWVAGGRPRFLKNRIVGRATRLEAWKQRSPGYRIFRFLRPAKPGTWNFSGTFKDTAGRSHPIRFFPLPSEAQNADRHPGWAPFAQAIRQGSAICQKNNIRLIILLVPMKFRVMGETRTELNDWTRQWLAGYREMKKESTIAAHLEALCGELGVSFVDATPLLRAHADQGELVYLPFDTHLSPKGHTIIADRLAEAIRVR
jgi:hypothetical protein